MDQVMTVPAANIAAMIVSFIVAGGMPIWLCIFISKKFKAKVSSFFIGCGSFFLFAMILEQLCHYLVLYRLGEFSERLSNNIWLYALYGGLAAGLFEETGRFVSMRLLMKKNLNRENALMYGAGHGGIEAILILGTTSFNNILISLMINGGMFEQTLPAGADRAAVLTSLAPLWTLPAWQFYMGAIERIMAVTLQLALSVLVYQAAKSTARRYWFFVAVFFHVLVDFAVVVVANQGNLIAAEGVTLVITILVAAIAYRLWQREVV